MKQKGPSIERSDWVQAIVDSKGVVSVVHDPTTGTISFPGAIDGTTKLVRSYKRASGKEKIVMEIPSLDGTASFSAYANLKRDFHNLIAVDTNTKKYDGCWLSIAVAYAVPNALSRYGSEMPFNFLQAFARARRQLSSSNEEDGWRLILDRCIRGEYFTHGRQLGLVVDSRLGDIAKINNRTIPYAGKEYLPPHATLIYASDAMTDGLPNQMIRSCDAVANGIFKEFSEAKRKLPESAFNEAIAIAVTSTFNSDGTRRYV